MTAPAIQPVEQKQTAPPLKHAHCPGCYPTGGTVPTMCGDVKRAGPRRPGGNIPAEACVVCLELVYVPCAKCGWHW